LKICLMTGFVQSAGLARMSLSLLIRPVLYL
jgi:hypothetical protein